MRLAVDARNIYRSNRRGTGKNLIDLYRELAVRRPDWEFLMFYQLEVDDDPFEGFDNVRRIRIDIKGDRFDFWEQIRLPIAVWRWGADVLHCPANTGPMFCPVPIVVTVHDLNWFGRFASREGIKRRKNLEMAVRKARKIIVPSEYTKSQIVKRFCVSTDNIIVNYWAPDRKCEYVSEADKIIAVKKKYGLQAEERYVFGFGASAKRKNTDRLLESWSLLPADIRKMYKLLLVGIDGRVLSDFENRAEKLGIGNDCLLRGFAAEEDVPVLMSGADVVCYVSLSEGFGLPILDAFVCRSAVVTSNVTSMPEIAGDAAILVNPESSESITAGLKKVLLDRELREELVRKGSERVKMFTWEECAERAERVFEEIGGEEIDD